MCLVRFPPAVAHVVGVAPPMSKNSIGCHHQRAKFPAEFSRHEELRAATVTEVGFWWRVPESHGKTQLHRAPAEFAPVVRQMGGDGSCLASFGDVTIPNSPASRVGYWPGRETTAITGGGGGEKRHNRHSANSRCRPHGGRADCKSAASFDCKARPMRCPWSAGLAVGTLTICARLAALAGTGTEQPTDYH
jgi:hypothetical protein